MAGHGSTVFTPLLENQRSLHSLSVLTMGQSAPTVTQMMDRFQQRYGGFRAGLPRSEQALFDRLLVEGHRHSTSLNSHPELDFERPLFLAMLLGVLERLERDREHVHRRLYELESRLPRQQEAEPVAS